MSRIGSLASLLYLAIVPNVVWSRFSQKIIYVGDIKQFAELV
jgi:hypothetical protein